MTKMNLYERACLVLLVFTVIARISSAQTFTTLFSFHKSDGAEPVFSSLVQGLDGKLYGTAGLGGAKGFGSKKGAGTVFRMTTGGAIKTLHSFCANVNCSDGEFPKGGVILGTDGNFYGTTAFGGTDDGGTVFEMTPSGNLTTLYSFGNSHPFSVPVQAASGSFYGTTAAGGDGGTVFRMTAAGTVTTLHEFDGSDGSKPFAPIVQGTNESFYGTTATGGASSHGGTVFEISPGGTLTTLHSFDTSDGAYPYSALVQATDGNFYGTTELGGANEGGTVFRITPGGALTTLYSFCALASCGDGEKPVAGLVEATDGNFYGTTELGGASGRGTVFQITPGGTVTTLYSFCAQANCADGEKPLAGLLQATNGNFYGATSIGGANNFGTIFSLAMGLGSFVETVPGSGKGGALVKILGTNLTGATSGTFNGAAATFIVVSASEIKTIVPNSATSGFVSVTTPGGTLSSNVAFRFHP